LLVRNKKEFRFFNTKTGKGKKQKIKIKEKPRKRTNLKKPAK
jgi:hypothetical protein